VIVRDPRLSACLQSSLNDLGRCDFGQDETTEALGPAEATLYTEGVECFESFDLVSRTHVRLHPTA